MQCFGPLKITYSENTEPGKSRNDSPSSSLSPSYPDSVDVDTSKTDDSMSSSEGVAAFCLSGSMAMHLTVMKNNNKKVRNSVINLIK